MAAAEKNDTYDEIEKHHSSVYVQRAICASQQKEHGKPVGWDVFEITGHRRVGAQVVLTLKRPDWVRDLAALDALVEDQP